MRARLSVLLDPLAHFLDEARAGRMQLGRIVIVSEKRETQAQIAAFKVGRWAGPPPPEPKRRERSLQVV